MKRIALIIAVFGVLCVLSTPVMAGDGMHTNIIQVSHPYYGGHHGGYYGAYRTYYPPVYNYYSPVVVPYTAYPPAMFPPAAYNPYYYHPQNSFYYGSPRFSIGVGF